MLHRHSSLTSCVLLPMFGRCLRDAIVSSTWHCVQACTELISTLCPPLMRHRCLRGSKFPMPIIMKDYFQRKGTMCFLNTSRHSCLCLHCHSVQFPSSLQCNCTVISVWKDLLQTEVPSRLLRYLPLIPSKWTAPFRTADFLLFMEPPGSNCSSFGLLGLGNIRLARGRSSCRASTADQAQLVLGPCLDLHDLEEPCQQTA